MNSTKVLLALTLSVTIAYAAEAATVTLTLYVNQNAAGVPSPGQFRVTAKVAGNDNAGLAGYGGDLTGNILSLDNQSPRDPTAQKGSQMGPAGFTFARSMDNVPFVVGYQDTSQPNVIPIYGFGQTASSFAAEGIIVGGANVEGVVWDAELLLATGTFSGATPGWIEFGLNRGAVVFNNNMSRTVRGPESLIYSVIYSVPEPPTAGVCILGMASFALINRRRQR